MYRNSVFLLVFCYQDLYTHNPTHNDLQLTHTWCFQETEVDEGKQA